MILSDHLLTVPEACRYLNISSSTLYRYCRRRIIPYSKTGFGYRFDKETLAEWIGAHKRDSRISIEVPKKVLTFPQATVIDKEKGGNGAVARAKKRRLNCGFGYIYVRETKQGKPRFYLDYRDSEGKRKQELDKTATSWEEAIISLQKRVQREHDKKNGIVRKRENVGFSEFADIYLESYAKVVKKSWQTDEFRLRVLKRFFKNIDLREISPLMIQKYRASRFKTGVSEITTNREIALLKKMFNLAIDEGYLEKNPARKIRMFSEMDTVRDRVLTLEEEKRLLKELADHVRPFVLTALHTGLRYKKVLELSWADVNFSTKRIKVEKTKSKKVRFIHINSVLLSELRKLSLKRKKGSRVFPFKSVKTAFENACRRARVEDFTFHDLRRTFGTRLLEKGVDIVTISKLYGHSSVLVTQRYLHPKDELSREAVELLVESGAEKSENGEGLLHTCYMEQEGTPLIN